MHSGFDETGVVSAARRALFEVPDANHTRAGQIKAADRYAAGAGSATRESASALCLRTKIIRRAISYGPPLRGARSIRDA